VSRDREKSGNEIQQHGGSYFLDAQIAYTIVPRDDNTVHSALVITIASRRPEHHVTLSKNSKKIYVARVQSGAVCASPYIQIRSSATAGGVNNIVFYN